MSKFLYKRTTMNLKPILSLLLFCFFAITLSAQSESKLAQQYYSDGEFEKAAVLYEKLYAANNRNDYFFNRYIESLLALENYDDAEKAIKKELKKSPEKVQLYVTYGKIYERQFQDEEAQKQYARAIKELPADRFTVTKLANAFVGLTKYDLAAETYEKGMKLLKDNKVFAYNLGDLYRRKGDAPKMIENYLNSLDANPGRLNSLQTTFQRYLTEEDFTELQTQLYGRIQSQPEALHYPEFLSWVFIQKKDYRNALRQMKALDKKAGENGGRVFGLGGIAFNAKDYDAAISAYEYIINDKGTTSSFYIDAKRELLRTKRQKVTSGVDYTREDLLSLEKEYEDFLNEFRYSKTTASIVKELADLEALYLNDIDKSIDILNRLIKFPGINPKTQGEAKIALADYYLIQGEIWESTLLYSQVDKAFEEDLLGHEARFRNAKLSYYNGNFEWAQAQFSVLKASTSKLIANDALDLSIFIMDNLGLDTTTTTLQLYADADLLTFQNKYDAAFAKLDTISKEYPEHSLQDDVFYAEAKIYKKQRNYVKAAEMYNKVIENFPEEIRADNALFELAELYENPAQLNDLEKAKALYEKIFLDYSGSTFAVEARKRYRKLRGDDI